jgi:hypothetical protein
LEARTGATVLVPNITELEGGSLIVRDTGIIPTAQLRLLTNVDLTVDGATPGFTHLTNINNCSVYARGGGVVHLTQVTSTTQSVSTLYWQAEGMGSRLDLSSLTNAAVGYNARLFVRAYDGGSVDLRRLHATTNALQVLAEGTDSVVDLSGLSGRWGSLGGYDFGLEAKSGASVLIPNVTELEGGFLTVRDTATITTGQLTLLTNVILTVVGATPDFGRLTNINDCAVYAQDGGIARLTNVINFTQNVPTLYWQAEGPESRIDLSSLTRALIGYNSRLFVRSFDGGMVDLHHLHNTANAIQVRAEDSGSVVDLSGLTGRWASRGNHPISLEVKADASVLIPNVTELENGTLIVHNTGKITTSQLTLMTNVDLTVDGATPDFGRVANINDCAVYAQNGGVARLTNVTCVDQSVSTLYWQAEGVGSLVDLSCLTDLDVDEHARLFVRAYDGGTVDLSRLASLSTGAVQFLANGTGSSIDLRNVSSFIATGNYESSLTTQNGGTFLFNDQAFLLSNVAIDLSSENPILPSTLIASPSLTLYGKPWHSYWVEKRDAAQADSPWALAMRVPLVTPFQAIAREPLPDTAYRVWDFVANPGIIDVSQLPGQQPKLVQYGAPNSNYRIATTLSLDVLPANWTTWTETGAMTNAFRFLPNFPGTEPKQFFRSQQL